MLAILLTSLSIIIVVVAILVYFVMRRRDQETAQDEIEKLADLQIIPPEGIRIPVTQTFTGFKALGAFGISHNNMNPLLKIYDDRIEYRVIIKTAKRYGEIEWIKPVGNRRLRITFYGSLLSLSVWLTRPEDRVTLVNFLQARGVNIVE
jgi:hypothetical protein